MIKYIIDKSQLYKNQMKWRIDLPTKTEAIDYLKHSAAKDVNLQGRLEVTTQEFEMLDLTLLRYRIYIFLL